MWETIQTVLEIKPQDFGLIQKAIACNNNSVIFILNLPIVFRLSQLKRENVIIQRLLTLVRLD